MERKSDMSEETKIEAKAQGLSEAEADATITSCVAKILYQQGEQKEWGISEHLTLLWKIAQELGMDDEAKKDFFILMRSSGLGGNQSQFRQSKFLKGKLPENKRTQALKAYD